MRILQIEDDAATAQAVELMLKSEGMKVYTTDLGEEGADLARHYDYDLILLDLNLPDMSGIDVLRAIRLAKVATPVLVLTGSDHVDTKVKAFGAGADDYMIKPFHKDELVARIIAIVRRCAAGAAEPTICVGPIRIELGAKVVTVGEQRLHLTPREYGLLEALALRRGLTLSKDVLFEHLYQGRDEPELKIIDVFVCKLRKKLGPDAARHLETAWGSGYRLIENPEPAKVKAPLAPSPGPTIGERIATRLGEGEATFLELLEIDRGWSPGTVRGVLQRLVGQGLVYNAGSYGSASYRLRARAEAAA